MNSVMELLVMKQHPDYTEDEAWAEIWDFCLKHKRKVELFLKRYEFPAGTNEFEKKRKQLMDLICNATDHEVQWVLRQLSNFETALLLLLADKCTEEKLLWNMTKRLERFISTEAYVITKKINSDAALFGKLMDKVMAVFFSQEFLQKRKEREEAECGFSVEGAVSLEQKRWLLLGKSPMHSIGRWKKVYDVPQGIHLIPIYCLEGYFAEWFRTIGDLLYDNSYAAALEAAYHFSESGKGEVSFLSSGLMLDKEEKIVFVTYIIRGKEGVKKIYRCTNELAQFPELGDEIKGNRFDEVTEEDFFWYCRQIYGREF